MKDDALKLIREASRLNDRYMVEYPNEHRFQIVRSALDKIKRIVADHWPLTSSEKEMIDIGLYAVRELEERAEDLAGKLQHLDSELRRST